MKYLVLICGNEESWDWDTWSKDEFDRTNREMDKIIDEFRESGELIDGHGLAAPRQTKTVWLKEGVPVLTDGPFGPQSHDGAAHQPGKAAHQEHGNPVPDASAGRV
jgi:hypothetical protein